MKEVDGFVEDQDSFIDWQNFLGDVSLRNLIERLDRGIKKRLSVKKG